MPSERLRQRFNFWLDLNKTDDAILAHEIQDLKKCRQFSQTIRDGIRLIVDLRRGNTSVLCELFPLIEERLRQGHSGEVIAMLDEMKSLLDGNGNGAGQWNSSQITTPVFDSIPVAKIVENEDEKKKLSIKNTLDAINDF